MINRIALLATTALLAGPTNAAPRQLSAAEAAAAFGAREQIERISLSPDGTHIAMIEATAGRASAVTVVDLTKEGAPVPISRSSGDPDRFTRCGWVTDARLLCTIYLIGTVGSKLDATRQVAMNRDGSDVKIVTAGTTSRSIGVMQDGGSAIDLLPSGEPGKVLMTRQFVPEEDFTTRMTTKLDGYGVELFDITSGGRKIVEAPRPDAVDYISDGHGAVRVRALREKNSDGYDGNRIAYQYRRAGTEKWLPLSMVAIDNGRTAGFSPVAVDRELDVVYGFDADGGRQALYQISLDGSLRRERVLARPDVDVDALVRIGRQRRVVGGSYATDRRQIDFFDPALNKLGASLAKALPGRPLIGFVDASADESKLLIFAGSDTDPGSYYLYDKTSRKMEQLLAARPQLAGVTLATVTPVSFPAADGTSIPGYLTLPPGGTGKNLPAIVMPHGGPGARDEWGFDWLAQYYAHRGFAVLQPNFRGSTGYGDAWFRDNGFKSWRLAIGDVNDGGRWLVKQGIADPGKLGIVGWSYGGYAALQSSVLDPDLFKAVVAIAPVTDLETLRQEARGFATFATVDALIGTGPHVREGSPATNAASINAPVLLFHGSDDLNVGVGESRLMASRLKAAGKKVELVEFPKLDHQLVDSKVRAEMLAKSDAFLRASMGM